MFLPLVAYSAYVNSLPILDAVAARQLQYLAYLVILLNLVGISVVGLGVRRYFKEFRTPMPHCPRTLAIIAHTFDQRRYRRVMYAVTLVYAGIFAFLSGIVVYSPLENFAGEYLVKSPSVMVAVCCGSAGLIPVLTVLVTNHLGLLLIPLDIIILVSVSVLVGLNATLVVYQYDKRARSHSGRWVLGVGAACGLFTACPTCAGLFLSTIVLGVGSSALGLLSGMQLFFVLGAILVLILGISLSANTLGPE